MNLRKTSTSLQSSVNEETTDLRRLNRFLRSLVDTSASPVGQSKKRVPRKKPTGRYEKKRKCITAKQKQHFAEPPLVTAGHETPLGETRDGVPAVKLPSLIGQEKPMGHQMPPGETRDGVPAVELPSLPEREIPMGHEMPSGEAKELPSLPEQEKPMGMVMKSHVEKLELRGSIVDIPGSPQEKKPNIDLLFLLEKARKPNSRTDDPSKHREHLLNAASVLKFKLVTRLTSSEDRLSTKDMITLANRCFSALVELEDDYTSFHREVKKLIAQHQQVEFAAKDKEGWNDWDIKARYMLQVRCLSSVEEKLSSAQDKLTTAKANLEFLKLKKIELLRILTTELYEEEERVKTLTAERDQFQKSHSDIKDGIDKLDAEKAEASAEFKAIDAQYNAAKKEFEKMSSRLLQLVEY